jgi:two-component SAPR family response regulator
LSAWKEALGLIRGVFLDGLTLTDWAVFDGTSAQVESMVVITALKGITQALGAGDGEAAEWMVRQALLVSPYDERLYRALLRAIDAQGNRAVLRSTMAELLALAGDGGAWDDADEVSHGTTAIHPRTISLYRELVAWRSMPATRG